MTQSILLDLHQPIAALRVRPSETRDKPIHGGSRLWAPASFYLVHPWTRAANIVLAKVSEGLTRIPTWDLGILVGGTSLLVAISTAGIIEVFQVGTALALALTLPSPLKDAEEGRATGMNGQEVHSRAARDRMSRRTDDIKQRVTRVVA